MPPQTSSSSRSQPLRHEASPVDDIVEIGNRFYILATSSLGDGGEQVLKHGESFALFDRFGDVKPIGMGEEGFYHNGTRHLSSLLLRIGSERPLLLGSTAKRDNSRLSVDLTNSDLTLGGTVLAHGSLHVARSKVLWDGVCHERIVIRNFALTPVEISVSVHFGADFADIFEVRGVRRERRGTLRAPEVSGDEITFGYDGLDAVQRRTRIGFDPAPAAVDAGSVRYDLELAPGAETTLEMAISAETDDEHREQAGYGTVLGRLRDALRESRGAGATVSSSSDLFNDWIDRGVADLVMMTSETDHGPYPYAGVPWFSTVFGRDGIIAARQALWAMPSLARGVLGYLAATQADEDDPAREAQPGKIIHEVRRGEMAATGEIPFARYYGTHDATPLFVWLAADYHQRTDDTAFIQSIWPSIEAAIAWMDGPADADGDGFLDYLRRTPIGLAQQGWKDSSDSIFHADGTLADGPTALCEIQGYAFAAKRGAAELAEALDMPERAEALRTEAEALRQRFEDAFWLEELGTYAIALDGNNRPCRVRSSNPGHCLMTGIASPERAARVAESLMSDASFSGWGIRTLAAGEPRYNPMSYHNGSIWPHDNGMVALGLARYGFKDDAVRIMSGLLEASRHFDLARLPELFCGFSRRDGEAPTLYPVACSPQAWAAGAPLMLLEACLGLRIDARSRTIRFERGALPVGIDRVKLENLSVGDARVGVMLERHRNGIGVNVLAGETDVEIVNVR
ncbi:MAG: amylo-alpha-1,6-glucosidase [Candidatus Limnocylindria bacterium]